MHSVTIRSSPRTAVVLAAALSLVCAASVLLAQRAAGGGRNLQANMRVATPPKSGMTRQAYVPGYSRQPKPLYTTSRSGEMIYAPNNAFSPRSSYTTMGYSRGNPYSKSSMKRFRGYGAGAGGIGRR